MESSGSYNSLPDETRRGPLEQAFRRRTVRDVLALVDDLDAKAEFAPLERAYVVYSVLKTRQYADEGARWANLGAIIFFVGIVCAALTPALVALTGMYAFSNAPKFHRLQFAAICASLMGTIAHALDDSLRLRQRGRARIDHACEMRELFDSYCAVSMESRSESTPGLDVIWHRYCNLAGPFVADAEAPATSHRGAAYLTYCDAFRRLQERCRADAATR
ncbi:unnamed protein product [Pelagomonas calceolata]|uniref:Uncharacterized protein n=1 Tax=Pelagomonas calceolata TaxID=35677 RepID=A0A8J2SV00_9STRA|nr:unnamed protein product [Pelagomonas calceolata]